jgi:CHAT domain-containing protein
LATHGYFQPAKDGADVPPEFRSALALAGANRQTPAGRRDGLLTAVEVASLDLDRVQLAVLSACETGLGDSHEAEGVLGLQRAFQVAGARSVVASLWSVADEPTRVLMERFYANLWRKDKPLGKLEALRQAQLWLLREGATNKGIRRGMIREDLPAPASDGRLPPYYWAAFVLSGDWR